MYFIKSNGDGVVSVGGGGVAVTAAYEGVGGAVAETVVCDGVAVGAAGARVGVGCNTVAGGDGAESWGCPYCCFGDGGRDIHITIPP